MFVPASALVALRATNTRGDESQSALEAAPYPAMS
jgi:hypothetical protein